MKKVVVILSGCGIFDGAEIHESVLTLLALNQAGAEYICAAPNINQYHVVNHQTLQPSSETRNVRDEAARIARGEVKALNEIQNYDAVILPGGFGVAKNLSTFATEGQKFNVEPSIASFLKTTRKQNKPMGFMCIAPAIAARLFGNEELQFTIGNDLATANILQTWGAKHIVCAVDDIVIDKKCKIVTTPAYMLAKNISEAQTGISKLVKAVLQMA